MIGSLKVAVGQTIPVFLMENWTRTRQIQLFFPIYVKQIDTKISQCLVEGNILLPPVLDLWSRLCDIRSYNMGWYTLSDMWLRCRRHPPSTCSCQVSIAPNIPVSFTSHWCLMELIVPYWFSQHFPWNWTLMPKYHPTAPLFRKQVDHGASALTLPLRLKQWPQDKFQAEQLHGGKHALLFGPTRHLIGAVILWQLLGFFYCFRRVFEFIWGGTKHILPKVTGYKDRWSCL